MYTILVLSKVRDYVPEELADFAEALANPRAQAPSRSSSCVNPPQPGQLPMSPTSQNSNILSSIAQQQSGAAGNASSSATGVMTPIPVATNAADKSGTAGALAGIGTGAGSKTPSSRGNSESHIVYRMDSDDSLDTDGREARKNNRTASAGNAAALIVNPPGPHSSGTIRKISARLRHKSQQTLQQTTLAQAQAGAQAGSSSSPATASALSPPTLTSFISNLITSVQNQLGGSHHSSKASSSSGSGSASGNTNTDPKLQQQQLQQQQQQIQQQQQPQPMHTVSIRPTRSPVTAATSASSARRSSAMPSTTSSGGANACTGGGGGESSLLGGMGCGLLSTRMCSTPEIPRRSGATSAATSPNMNSSPMMPRSPGSQRSFGSAALAVRTSLTPPFGGVGQLGRAQHAHLDISREHEQIVATLAEGSTAYAHSVVCH